MGEEGIVDCLLVGWVVWWMMFLWFDWESWSCLFDWLDDGLVGKIGCGWMVGELVWMYG